MNEEPPGSFLVMMIKNYKDILRIALPAMMENFLQFLMGMVDSYLVAHLGLVAISGVAVANNIMTIFQALFMALGSAASVLLATSFSKKRREKVEEQVAEVLKLTLIIGGILGFCSIFGGKYFLVKLGTEPAVAQAGGLYLSLLGGTVVLVGLMATLGAILRTFGKSRWPMYVSLVGNLLNILFSSVAVFVFQTGIIGVAVGTILARLVACLLLWKQLPVKSRLSDWSIDKELLRLALPTAGERLMMRAGDVVVVALIVSLGTPVVAGNAIGETLTQFNYMPGIGVATGLVILVAQAQAANNKRNILDLLRAGYVLSLIMMVVIAAIVFLFSDPLSRLYTQDKTALEASRLVIFYSLVGAPATVGTQMLTAIWQGLGKAQLPFYATTIGMWLIRIGLASLLILTLGWGLVGVWWAIVLDNLFRWGLLSIFLRFDFKKR